MIQSHRENSKDSGIKKTGVRYDLLLKGGEFIDPASGRRGQFDVAFADDKVAAIESNIDPNQAKHVESASGTMVVPGLFDMHVHAVEGFGGSAKPDVIGINRGVTTLVDGGSLGARSFGIFKYVLPLNKTRVFATLNISTIGQLDTRMGEAISMHFVARR